MNLRDLKVVHLSKGHAGPSGMALSELAAEVSACLPGAFHFDSCQRWIWVTHAPITAAFDSAVDIFEGEEGYRFLLSVACGLESQVVGETDIFGQLKEAWKSGGGAGGETIDALSAWFPRIFEDTKEIRSRFLRNVGGHSYGSLARLLIKENGEALGPVLFVGAGKIATSVAPYFCDREILIANRSLERARKLREELLALHPDARVRVLETREEELAAWASVSDVVVCVPFPSPLDSEAGFEKIALWQNRSDRGTILHLGGGRQEAGEWARVRNFRSLDDLFELRKARGDVRSLQTPRAAAACVERAKLRALGTSITLPHGWEDLAAFA